MSRLAVLLGMSVCAAQLITAADFASIDVLAEGSHQRFLNSFSNQTERAYLDVTGIYDAAIATDPENPLLLLEKCKFLEGVFPVSEDGGHPKQADLDAAIRQLAERFPRDPEAILYRSERLYGPKRVQFLQEFATSELTTWTETHRSRLFESLAWAQYSGSDFADAKKNAEVATRLDPSRDLSLIIASYYDSINRPHLVAQVLIARLHAETEPWKKYRKAELLNKAGYPQLALRIYETFADQREVYVNALEYADVLEKTGRSAAARKELVKATEGPWQADSARWRLFEFDLQHGDEKDVLESYRALCADGLENDPLLRRRLAVAVKFPTAPWTVPDVIRLALLALVVALLLLLPLAWILPVHYVGLLRERRATPNPLPEPLWNLRHLWCVSVVWLLATFLSLYCFQYDEFSKFILDEGTTEFSFNPGRLAPMALTYALVFSSGVLALLRKRHWLLTIQNRWGFWRSALIVIGFAVLLRIAFYLVSRLPDLAMGSLLSAMDFPGLTSARVQMILALGKQYGIGTLFLFVVIVAPLTEEFVFRGILLDSVGRHLPFHVANVAQAIAFGVLHQEPSHFLFFVLFGWIAGMMRRESNGLALPLCFHVVNNLIAFVAMSRMLP